VKARFGFSLLICGLLGTVPAHAGLFGSTPAPKQPQVSESALSQIQTAFDDQRYVDASKLLNQAVLSSSSDPRLTYWAGQLSLARGRYEDALANFTRIKSDPSVQGLALEGEGIALARLGRSDQAMISLKAAIAANPAAWRAWNALGSEYDRRHDWTQAEAAYDHAFTASGGAAIVLNNRGFSRLSQKKTDLAIQDFVAALQKKPDLVTARSNLRLAMSMQGEYDRAVKGDAGKDQAAVLNNAGYAAMLRGDYAKAKELFEQAMKTKGGYYAVAAANLEMAQNLAKGQAQDAGHASSR
jgi:Flp pilus assembly protein TadD